MKVMQSWQLGDTKKEADNLLDLVLSGRKTATSSLYDSYILKNSPLPNIGDKSIIMNSKGIKKCLIVITKVSVKPFKNITKSFALKEGEGDRSLEYWKKSHKYFFQKKFKNRGEKFKDDSLIVCEEFKVLKII